MTENNSEFGMKRTRRINRRSVLKAAGGAAFFTGVTGGARAAGHDSVTIPIVVSGEEIIEERTVPEDWWNYIKRVRRATAGLRKDRGQEEGVVSVNVGIGDRTVAGRVVTAVEVEVDSESFSGELPDERNGVEVRRAEKPIGASGGCYNDGDFNNMHGGVTAEGSHFQGTSCCRDDNYKQMLTAAHLYDACDRGSSIDGDDLDQNGRYAGHVEDYNIDEDWVACDDDSGTVDYTNKIETEGSTYPVEGSATNYEFLISEGTFVYQMGVSTGQRVGQMTAYDVTANVASGDEAECVDLNGRGVRIDANQQYFGEGDSGGPLYLILSNSVALVGIGQIGYNSSGTHNCGSGGTVWTRCEGISSERLVEHGFTF